MTIGFIGAGKVGVSFGKYLAQKGAPLSGYYSKSYQSAKDAAAFTKSTAFHTLPDFIAASSIIFITVADDLIPQVWQEIRNFPIQHKLICHCSGALSSEIFEGAQQLGASAYSLHPMCAVRDKWTSHQHFEHTYFTIEGCGRQTHLLTQLVESLGLGLGNGIARIDADKKVLYHAACVTLSNLMVGLAKVGIDLLEQCGLDAQFVQEAWQPLFLENANNICRSGIMPSLTGPLERGDAATIIKHLAVLNSPAKELYASLSCILLEVAALKHPGRDYQAIAKEIN